MADIQDPLVDVEILGDHVLLAGRMLLRDLDRLQRSVERLGKRTGALRGIGEAEHLVDDTHVGEQIRDRPCMRIALHVVEEHGAAAADILGFVGEGLGIQIK